LLTWTAFVARILPASASPGVTVQTLHEFLLVRTRMSDVSAVVRSKRSPDERLVPVARLRVKAESDIRDFTASKNGTFGRQERPATTAMPEPYQTFFSTASSRLRSSVYIAISESSLPLISPTS